MLVIHNFDQCVERPYPTSTKRCTVSKNSYQYFRQQPICVKFSPRQKFLLQGNHIQKFDGPPVLLFLINSPAASARTQKMGTELGSSIRRHMPAKDPTKISALVTLHCITFEMHHFSNLDIGNGHHPQFSLSNFPRQFSYREEEASQSIHPQHHSQG